MADLTANVNVEGTWYGPAYPDNKVTSQVREAITNPNVWDDAPTRQESTGDYPVDGTAAEVQAWVDDDSARARQALLAEQARPEGPRSSLVAKLERTASEG